MGLTAEGLPVGYAFPDWNAALDFVAARAGGERLVVVLDEFPYLSRSSPGIESVVQRWWDQRGRRREVMLVLATDSLDRAVTGTVTVWPGLASISSTLGVGVIFGVRPRSGSAACVGGGATQPTARMRSTTRPTTGQTIRWNRAVAPHSENAAPRIAANVFGDRISPACRGTVTRPGLVGWRSCACEPLWRSTTRPSRRRARSMSAAVIRGARGLTRTYRPEK